MPATIQTIQKPTRARALDTSGNNNHGQIYSGRGLEFDGVTDYLTSANNIGISGDPDGFTMSAWFRLDAVGANQCLIFSGAVTAHYENLFYVTSSNKLAWNNQHSDADFTNSSGTTLVASTWYHGVVTYNGSNTIKIYLNGVLDGSKTDTSNINITDSVLYIGDRASTTIKLTGKMANVQVWDAVWSADDALYAYNNPEQLALNRGGTSLTNSNLKLWYPMQDGHRGQQSFILDGANTGLGSEVITDGSFDNNGTSWSGDKIKWTFTGNKALYDDTGIESFEQTAGNMVQNFVAGNIGSWKVTFDIEDVTETGNKAYLRFSDNNNLEFIGYTAYGNGTNSAYFNSTSASNGYGFRITASTSSASSFKMDNISVKSVNAKNHATTVFYGDEQISATNDRTFAGASNWQDDATTANQWAEDGGTYNESASTGADESTALTNYAGETITFTDNYLNLVATNDDADVRNAYLDGAAFETNMVVGRTYRLSYAVQISAFTSGAVSVGLANASHSMSSARNAYAGLRTAYAHYVEFVYEGTTNHAEILISATVSSVFTSWFDNFSIKEVGTATGWTDADQQLDIPQTALQSYNQLAWFDGQNGNDATLDSQIDTSTNNWSLSFWIFHKDNDQLFDFPFGSGSTKNIALDDNVARKLYYREASGGTYQAISDAEIPQGEWVHIVITAIADTSITAYVNGETQTTNSSMSATQLVIDRFMEGYTAGSLETLGSITEISYYDDVLTEAEAQDLYNDGKAKSALDADGSGNLVGYWRNNGLAEWKDLKGSNDANTNGVTETLLIPAGVDGSRDNQGFLMNRQKDTNALNLSGIDYVDARDDDVFTFVNGGFSLECWFKMDITPTDVAFLIGKTNTGSADGSNNTEYGLFLDANKKIFIRLFDDSASAHIGAYYNTALNLNQWYHVVCTHTEDGTASSDCKIYLGETATPTPTELKTDVDSESAATYVAMENVTDNIPLVIGAKSSAESPFNGSIDDVRIYSKELSAPEITRNYNAGKRSHR